MVKTGGLADVVGALPGALAAHGVEMRVLLPGYPAVLAAMADTVELRPLPKVFGRPVRLLAGTVAGIEVWAVDAPRLYDRPAIST